MQELLPELQQSILLSLDCDSLLEYRGVNQQAQRMVQEMVPLLCVRDGFEETTKLYAWALLISDQQKTRYSHLFFLDLNNLNLEEPVLEATRQRNEKDLADIFNSISRGVIVVDNDYLRLSLREVLADPECAEWLIKNKSLYVTPYEGWDMKLDEGEFLQVILASHRLDLLFLLYPNKEEILDKISSLATFSDYYNLACDCQLTKIDQLSTTIEGWISKQNPSTLFLAALREGNLVIAKYLYNTFLQQSVLSSKECLCACGDANILIWLVNKLIATNAAALGDNRDLLDSILVLDNAIRLPDCHPGLLSFLHEKFTYTTVNYKQVLTLLKKGKFTCVLGLLDLPLNTKINSRDKKPNLGEILLLRCFYPDLFTPNNIILGCMDPFLRQKDLKETLRFFTTGVDYKTIVSFYLNQCELDREIIALLLEQSYQANNFLGGLPDYWRSNFQYERDEQLLAQLPFQFGKEDYALAIWQEVLEEDW